MRVGVWGAGNIGLALVQRLATTSFVSEIHWINRTADKITAQAVDLEHGLAYTPACRSVTAYPEGRAAEFVAATDTIIVTAGAPVKPGASRADVYAPNRVIVEGIAQSLKGYQGVVLVVSNPVDLMARALFLEAELAWTRVFGLGTVVETARLRASLGSYLGIPAHDVWAYGIGTHDERFVPMCPLPHLGHGVVRSMREGEQLLAAARDEAAEGARRVRTLAPRGAATLFPIVEGIVEVLTALARDRGKVLTVSVRDPNSQDDLFYSVPCCVTRFGVSRRLVDGLDDPDIAAQLEACRGSMLEVLRQAGGHDEGASRRSGL